MLQSKPEGRQNVRKKRTAVSCDRCKSRKTKCVDPVPGPCQYCARINASCRTDLNRTKKRPYYHVSEEEYQCMTKILAHYLPDLPLTLPALRDLSARLEVAPSQTPTTQGSSGSQRGPDHLLEPPAEDDEDGDGDGDSDFEERKESSAISEIQSLHERMGCLMIDSSGNYRHVGRDSSIGFNAAVRMLQKGSASEKVQPEIIEPLKTTSLPPKTPEAFVGLDQHAQVFLPSLENAYDYIQRYFDEVHCLYWLFSTEQFHERIHETYMTGGILESASWMCCIYSIFALGVTGSEEPGEKTAAEYLVMAKALVPQVHDEADVDSIRALCLLALALQAECYTNAAYLYIGTAVRIAFSLGLHVDKAPPSLGHLAREQNRRIWWTLYIVDYEIAHRYGNPCAVTEDSYVQMPSEQVLSPGTNTPLGYLSAASSLCTLCRRIRSTLHATTGPHGSDARPKISIEAVNTLLAALNTWLSALPPHLCNLAHIAPSHRRPVGILHLSYWANVILVTRPFILWKVIQRRSKAAAPPPHAAVAPEQKWFDKFIHTCVGAADSGLDIMRTMSRERTLSSLVTLDCSVLLELVQIFRLALVVETPPEDEEGEEGTGRKADSPHTEARKRQIHDCMEIIKGMQKIGWTAQALPELTAQLRESALLRSDDVDEPQVPGKREADDMDIEGTLDAFFSDMLDDFACIVPTSERTWA